MDIYTASLRGVITGCGTEYKWAQFPSGLMTSEYRTNRLMVGDAWGVRPSGADQMPSKMVTFDININQPANPALTELLLSDLAESWAPVESGVIALAISTNAGERVMFGRPVSFAGDLSEIRFDKARARCVFEATDPRLFGASVSSIVLGLTAGGGLTFPMTFPLTFGAGSDSDGSAVNAGNTSTPWTATIVGPVTTPRITLGETGEYVELDGVVPSGSTLIVNSDDQSVLLDGSPRPSWQTLLSRWWTLPRDTSTIRYRAASGSGSCTFAWRSAWL